MSQKTFKEYLKLLNRLYDITCSTISNIPYNLIFTTKFNDSSILIAIISCDYLNLSLEDEHVGDVTIPTQVIEYNQNFLQADQPIRLKYSNQIKLLTFTFHYWGAFCPRPQQYRENKNFFFYQNKLVPSLSKGQRWNMAERRRLILSREIR